MKTYYTLEIKYPDEKDWVDWVVHFGDYDKELVLEEQEDILNSCSLHSNDNIKTRIVSRQVTDEQYKLDTL